MLFRRKPKVKDPIDEIVEEGVSAMGELVKSHRKGYITREQKYVGVLATITMMYASLIGLANNDESLKNVLAQILDKEVVGNERKAGVM